MKNHKMATTPEVMLEQATQLVKNLSPKQMLEKQKKELRVYMKDTDNMHPKLSILHDAGNFQKKLSIKDVNSYLQKITEPALLSKADGELLWGRVQGTKYEKMAHDYIEQELFAMGMDEVHHDRFPSSVPLWRPTKNELLVTQAETLLPGEVQAIEDALTPFHSACTPEDGIEAEVIYVGEGSDAELHGRDLTGKIVLLRARTLPGGAMYGTCRLAFSRLAVGKHGKPAGVIVWWDIPNVSQVAGRVGAPGGGDEIGLSLPWISINDENGYYLRLLIDQSDNVPVKVRMNVQGVIEEGSQRETGNVFGVLHGCSDKYLLICTHVDGYFYGIYDNGTSIAINMTLAKYYASLPKEERPYGFVFMFEGGHEIPGCGGTIQFTKQYKEQIEKHLLLIIRIEHVGAGVMLEEGPLSLSTNSELPVTPMITNQSPLLKSIMNEAAHHYQISTANKYFIDPNTDEMAFYPPYSDFGEVISIGWIATGPYYHTTRDGEDPSFIHSDSVERMLLAYAYVISEIEKHSEDELRQEEVKRPGNSIFASDLFSMYLGKF